MVIFRLIKMLIVSIILFSVPLQAFANTNITTVDKEIYTLAKVPNKPEVDTISDTQVSLRIKTNNNPETMIKLYASNDKKEWELIKEEVNLNAFTDSNVVENTRRYYSVSAVNGEGIETERSPVLEVFVADPIDLSKVTLTLKHGKAKFDNLPEHKPAWVYVATLNQAGNKLIGNSPRFPKIERLEEWITYQLQFNNTYEVIFGIQIGEDESTRIEKTFVLSLGNSPQQEFENKVNDLLANISYEVDGDMKTKEAWIDVKVLKNLAGLTVKGIVSNVEKDISESATRYTGLKEKTKYILLVKISDGDRHKTHKFEFTTPDLTEINKVFKEKAKKIINEAVIKMDGPINSGKVWAEVTIPKNNYQTKISIDGQAFKGDNPYQLDNLKDNTEYALEFEITDGKNVYKERVLTTTPNRTPPKVKSAYYEQKQVVLIVESKSEVESK